MRPAKRTQRALTACAYAGVLAGCAVPPPVDLKVNSAAAEARIARDIELVCLGRALAPASMDEAIDTLCDHPAAWARAGVSLAELVRIVREEMHRTEGAPPTVLRGR